jgi:hypothetical protein
MYLDRGDNWLDNRNVFMTYYFKCQFGNFVINGLEQDKIEMLW